MLQLNSWCDFVIPIPMKGIPFNLHRVHLFVGDHFAWAMGTFIQLTGDTQAGGGFRGRDESNNRFIAK